METVFVIAALKLVGYGLATIGPGLGIGIACYGCCVGTARQPEVGGRLFTNFIIGAAPVSYTHLDVYKRQVELIASENFTSRAVMEAVGSVLTNKYAEGYPGKRYYGGCEKVDMVEDLARDRACELYGAKYANVQPHSGASANFGAYLSIIEPGDTVLGMSLDHGGHLTHGSPVNFSGLLYNIVSYGVNPETETIDYDELERIAKECRPKVIVGGASALSLIQISTAAPSRTPAPPSTGFPATRPCPTRLWPMRLAASCSVPAPTPP